MSARYHSLTALVVFALAVAPILLGQENQPAPDGKEVLLKGTLTPLEQEVSHPVMLKKGQAYNIAADSHGFFTTVQVFDPHGKKLMSASGAATFKAEDDGVFRLRVSSPGGSCGQYVVSVRPTNLVAGKMAEALVVGADGITVEAVLAKNDPIDKVRKKYCRTYDVQLKGAKTYVIDMTSQQFDAFLRLENAAGKELAQDDDSGGGNNARITFKAPSDGVYRLFATSFGLETGLFVLKIREK